MAGYYQASGQDGTIIEPQGGVKADAYWKGRQAFHVAASSAQVGGLHAEGDVGAVLEDFDWNVDGGARVAAAIGCDWSGVSGFGAGRVLGVH